MIKLIPTPNPSEADVVLAQKRHELIRRMFTGDVGAMKEMNKHIEVTTGIYTIPFPQNRTNN